jgi:hypothetical protein
VFSTVPQRPDGMLCVGKLHGVTVRWRGLGGAWQECERPGLHGQAWVMAIHLSFVRLQGEAPVVLWLCTTAVSGLTLGNTSRGPQAQLRVLASGVRLTQRLKCYEVSALAAVVQQDLQRQRALGLQTAAGS